MCLSILLIVSWCGSVELYVRLRQLSVNSSWCGQWQEAACVCVCEAGCGTSLTSTAELMCSSLRLVLKEVKLLVMKARTVLYTCWSTEISLTEVGAIQKHCRNIISALSQPFSSIYYIHTFVRLFYSAFKEYVFITTRIKPLTLLLIFLFRVLVELLEELSFLCLRLWWLTAETVQLFWKKCYSSIMYILFINSINRIVFIYILNLPLFLYFQFSF